MPNQPSPDEKVIPIICWKDDHKFYIRVRWVSGSSVIYLGDDVDPLPAPPAPQRRIAVPCPKCGAENIVELP